MTLKNILHAITFGIFKKKVAQVRAEPAPTHNLPADLVEKMRARSLFYFRNYPDLSPSQVAKRVARDFKVKVKAK